MGQRWDGRKNRDSDSLRLSFASCQGLFLLSLFCFLVLYFNVSLLHAVISSSVKFLTWKLKE